MTCPVSDAFLLTVAEMAEADRLTIAGGLSGERLMERAGRAVADAVSRRARPGQSVLVLCGPGNNGGDGFVAARLLQERGCRVTVALLGELATLSGDAGAAAARWTGPVAKPSEVAAAAHDIIVDALFGAGLSRKLDGEAAAAVAAINASGRPVVAVDVPSGLSGDSGRYDGEVIRAVETVTFFRMKPGHLLFPGRALCGLVTTADIGIAAERVFCAGRLQPSAFVNGPPLWQMFWPRLARDTHKYRRGAVLVLAGGLQGVGAPRLAARAALRIGAGLVTIACRPEALAAHAARGPDALMQRGLADAQALSALVADGRLGVALAGPALGLDAEAEAGLRALLRAPIALVLDADALTLLARWPDGASSMRERQAPCVLTPHEGEFHRLFAGQPLIAEAPSKLEMARRAAAALEVVIVLKGPDTVIAAPDGRAAINATGCAALASAGSGDVLGGAVAGLMAQGMPAFEAACAAVWLHGKAGEALGRGLIADDLPEELGRLSALESFS
ncbi:MAG: NAD(P)H-hydrate dehydratase [Bosea sp. (in: a-proteobacteria)]